MKTVKKNDVVKRVSDDKAYDLVHKEGYSYCPKSKSESKAKAK